MQGQLSASLKFMDEARIRLSMQSYTQL